MDILHAIDEIDKAKESRAQTPEALMKETNILSDLNTILKKKKKSIGSKDLELNG